MAQGGGGVDQVINSFMAPISKWLFKFVFVGVGLEDWSGDPILDKSGNQIELPLILLWLVLGALFFTVRFGFLNFRKLGLAFRTVKGKYSKADDPGEITHFQALTAALSATVGLGNIAGVAIAVSIGGPGAVFWMVLAGTLGMTSKFCECTLGVKYREIVDGKVFGGPMHYLKKGFAERDMKGLGKVLATLFAVTCVGAAFGGGNMFQANQSCQQLLSVIESKEHLEANKNLVILTKKKEEMTAHYVKVDLLEKDLKALQAKVEESDALGWEAEEANEELRHVSSLLESEKANYAAQSARLSEIDTELKAAKLEVEKTKGFFSKQRWVFGAILATLVGLVIIGGIAGIAKVTERLVPVMTAVYIIGCVIVLFANFSDIGAAFYQIFTEAFVPTAVGGGLIGVFIQGIRRSAFSNEAGFGSAPIAHAAVKTRYPASEGLVALLEPFMDTVVVCTMTGLAIVVTAPDHGYNAEEGIELTSSAFVTVIPWFQYVLLACVVLFAFSTMISWSYYGQQAWAFLFGKSRSLELIYKMIFCLFIVIGSSMSLGAVLDFSDGMLFMMSLFNLIGVYVLLPVVKREFEKFSNFAEKVDQGGSLDD